MRTLGRRWRWLSPLAQRYVEAFAGRPRPRRREVVEFLLRDEGFKQARERYPRELRVAEWLPEPQRMQPVPSAQAWKVPAIDSANKLADWLCLTPGELEWFANLKGFGTRGCNAGDERLSHYRYRLLAKKFGSIRLIEAPKERLKELQRKILADILEAIPAHPCVHGFLKGRSILTFAAPHVGQRIVLRMDLQDFFPTFGRARIQAFFRTAGYPESVAAVLGGICTHTTPQRLWRSSEKGIESTLLRAARDLYCRPHLPQGAPTSPALANLCAWRMDCRLNGLAQSCGAVYTRYADDLAFSGGQAFEKCVTRFATQAAAIVMEEGFSVHHRKTRVMRQGVRQYLAGLVTNEKVNVVRGDFERLKAILTNCVRHGPESQNREGHPSFRLHLAGRVGFVEMVNPGKGMRLRRIFEQIQW